MVIDTYLNSFYVDFISSFLLILRSQKRQYLFMLGPDPFSNISFTTAGNNVSNSIIMLKLT